MSAQFYYRNKQAYPELQDFDHAMRHYNLVNEPILDQLMKKFQSKYAIRELMIKKQTTRQQFPFVQLTQSNLMLDYELSKIKSPIENPYSETNKRQKIYPMSEIVDKLINVNKNNPYQY